MRVFKTRPTFQNVDTININILFLRNWSVVAIGAKHSVRQFLLVNTKFI